MTLRSILILLVALTGYGANSKAEDRLQSVGAFYALSVQDLDAAINWYQKYLDFKLVEKGGNEQRSGALMARAGATIELAQFRNARPLGSLQEGLQPYDVYGIFKIGFMSSDIEKTYKEIEASGAEIFFGVVSTSDGKKTFAIKDNEGNIIQFYGR